MEAARRNIGECPLRLEPGDIDRSGSAVHAAPHPHRPPAFQHAKNHVEEYGGIFAMDIKTECNGEDPAALPPFDIAHSQKDPIAASTLWIKEEDFEMKTENDEHKMIIVEELDIGPTVLQPKIIPHTVPSSDQTGPDPRPTTCFCNDAVPPPLCAVFARPAPQIKVEDEYCEGPEDTSNAGFVLDVRSTDNAHQRASRERARSQSDSECTIMDKQEKDQCRRRVGSTTECDCRTGVLRAKADPYEDDKQYECEYCKYSTTRKSKLISHIHTHKDEELYKYERCEDSSFRLNSLKTQTLTQRDQEKRFKCELCDYSGSRVGYLQVHMRTHTGEKPFKCKHCEYSAYRMGSLQSHMRTHSGEKPYKCKQCEYGASKLGELKTHIRTHSVEKPFKCEWCEYSTRKSADLKTHVLTHTGKKPYKCELCEYSASRMGHILIHKRIHTGEKPYKCEQCDYSAYCISHLRVHLRTHTGEKPYKCELCEYSTSYVSGLKRHMYLHTIN